MKKIAVLLNLKLLIIVVFSACNSAEKIDYKDYYKGRFDMILEESFIESYDRKTNLFIIPTTLCTSCDDGTYEKVKSIRDEIKDQRFVMLFITSDTLNSALINNFKKLHDIEIFKMSTEEANQKKLNFLESMYLQIENAKVVEYKVL